ncbi:MAG TPA: ABC transporter permease [Nocardioides sp.]|uniref:ABC transporter permease n=1 Tax=Nocardioides sp. TaxID=35761 RepID=UPI002ED799B2
MSTTVTARPDRDTGGGSTPAVRRTRPLQWLADHLVLILGLLVLLYMVAPVLVVVLMSFNDPAARNSYTFDGFTLANWTDLCRPYQLCSSVGVSLRLGLLATVVATLLGTLMAFAMVRHRFRGRGTANVLIFLPMATPEIVMGSSLLALFVSAGMASLLGFWTIFVAHVLFCLSFVVVTVKARLAGLDPRLEQAAADLYANEWQTFWRVSLPLVFPGILAAALLSFSLSFDDFIITNLNSGQTVTFPMFVWGAAQRGVPMQVNVIGTIMFLVALLVVVVGELGSRRRSRG